MGSLSDSETDEEAVCRTTHWHGIVAKEDFLANDQIHKYYFAKK